MQGLNLMAHCSAFLMSPTLWQQYQLHQAAHFTCAAQMWQVWLFLSLNIWLVALVCKVNLGLPSLSLITMAADAGEEILWWENTACPS